MGIASLFSGVGAIELGLRRHLPCTPLLLLCDVNPDAQRVLCAKFPDVPLHNDVATLARLPDGTTIVTAGSPCTDLSVAGRQAGIDGPASSLVQHVFRLVRDCATVRTIVLENVDNVVRLHRGRGVEELVRQVEALGFAWAYRILDARSFGLPQARRRFVLVAQRGAAPRWLLASRAWQPPTPAARAVTEEDVAAAGYAGLYINEGKRGCGFRAGTLPTLKSNGNGLTKCNGHHPHALLLAPRARRDGARLVKVHVEDAEAAQGLPRGWTEAAGDEIRRFARIGNAAPPPFFEFVGAGLAGLVDAPPDAAPPDAAPPDAAPPDAASAPPYAACGAPGGRWRAAPAGWRGRERASHGARRAARHRGLSEAPRGLSRRDREGRARIPRARRSGPPRRRRLGAARRGGARGARRRAVTRACVILLYAARAPPSERRVACATTGA